MSDMQYMVAVCDMGTAGRLVGTHSVVSTVADSAEKAKDWARNETACNWGRDPKDAENLHVLFVMEYPVGVEVNVVEYDEGRCDEV